jgi:hypothetical protein
VTSAARGLRAVDSSSEKAVPAQRGPVSDGGRFVSRPRRSRGRSSSGSARSTRHLDADRRHRGRRAARSGLPTAARSGSSPTAS